MPITSKTIYETLKDDSTETIYGLSVKDEADTDYDGFGYSETKKGKILNITFGKETNGSLTYMSIDISGRSLLGLITIIEALIEDGTADRLEAEWQDSDLCRQINAEDEQDSKIAEARLKEIEENPASLTFVEDIKDDQTD